MDFSGGTILQSQNTRLQFPTKFFYLDSSQWWYSGVDFAPVTIDS